jgi:hypothetical protein
VKKATLKGAKLTDEAGTTDFVICPRCIDEPLRKMPKVILSIILDYPTAKTVDGGECYGCGEYFGDLVNNTFKCHDIEWFDGDKCLECESLAEKKGSN